MYEVIAKDNHVIATVPDEFVRQAHRDGYLRKAHFQSGMDGFIVDEPMKAGPFYHIYLFLQRGYRLLPTSLGI